MIVNSSYFPEHGDMANNWRQTRAPIGAKYEKKLAKYCNDWHFADRDQLWIYVKTTGCFFIIEDRGGVAIDRMTPLQKFLKISQATRARDATNFAKIKLFLITCLRVIFGGRCNNVKWLPTRGKSNSVKKFWVTQATRARDASRWVKTWKWSNWPEIWQ